ALSALALFRCHEILGRCPRLSLTMLRLRRAKNTYPWRGERRVGLGGVHGWCFVIRHSCFVILVIVHLWSQNSKTNFLTHWKRLSRKVFSRLSELSPVRRKRTSRSPMANAC